MSLMTLLTGLFAGLLAHDGGSRSVNENPPSPPPPPVPPRAMDAQDLYEMLTTMNGGVPTESTPLQLYTTRPVAPDDARRLFAPARPMPGVVPEGFAFDSINNPMQLSGYSGLTEGMAWLGFPYLSELAQRTEYRRISETIAKDMTRRWFRLQATGDDDKTDKIKALEELMKLHKLQEKFTLLALLDGFFGRSHLYIDTGDTEDRDLLRLPLPVDPRMIAKGGLKGLRVVEPMWVYPHMTSANDPLKEHFYLPQTWWVMGKEIHRSRLLPFINREMPDMLKPAYAFAGLSLSQMAKPYVDNWLRTRQSVSDLIHSFSTPVLQTNMGAALNAGATASLKIRAALFNYLRDNNNLMILDKTTEDFKNVSAPLGALDHLQAQSQEHMASAVGIPLVVLLGISPSGLNATSEGELQVWAQFIHSAQGSFFDANLTTLLGIMQLHLFGEVDPSITHAWEPLRELSEEEETAAEKSQADIDAVYINAGVLSPDEIRQRLAGEADSPYQGLDLDSPAPPPPNQEQDPMGGMGGPGGGMANGPGGVGGPGHPANDPGGPGGAGGAGGAAPHGMGSSAPAGGSARPISSGAGKIGAAGGSARAPNPNKGAKDDEEIVPGTPNTGHVRVIPQDPNATVHVHMGPNDHAHIKMGQDGAIDVSMVATDAFDPNEPRDATGQWGSGGGSGGAPEGHHETSGEVELGSTTATINPSRNDMAKMLEASSNKELRALHEGSRLVVWNAEEALHQEVQRGLDMSDSVHRYNLAARVGRAVPGRSYQIGRYAVTVRRDGDAQEAKFMPGPLRAALGVRGMAGDAWNESAHHRGQPGNAGEFGPGGGGGSYVHTGEVGEMGGRKIGHASSVHLHADPGARGRISQTGAQAGHPLSGIMRGAGGWVRHEGQEDYEILHKRLSGEALAPEKRHQASARVLEMAKALPELIKGKLVEEKDNVINSAGALKALGTGHKPTPEQWKALGGLAFKAAFIGGSMMIGDPTGASAHGVAAAGEAAAHGIGALAGEVGNELITHVLVEHALKTMVGGGMMVAKAFGRGGTGHDADPAVPATGADPTPDDIALVQKFLAAIAKAIEEMDEPTARKLLAENQGAPAAPAGQAHDEEPWDESKHPRGQPDNAGQFGPGGGGSAKPKAGTPRKSATPKPVPRTRTTPVGPRERGEAPEPGPRAGTPREPVPPSTVPTTGHNRAVEFYSPSVAEHLDLSSAAAGLHSERQHLLESAAHDIDGAMHVKTINHGAIGAWSDGAENSIMTEMTGGTWEQLQANVAMKASLANQKDVLVFQEATDGHEHLYSFHATGSVEKIHQDLLADGVAFHTIVPIQGGGATIYAVDMGDNGEATSQAVAKAAQRYGTEPTDQPGRAKFVVGDNPGTTGQEQRHIAQLAYGSIIKGSGVPHVADIWKGIRPTFEQAFEVSEYDKTETKTPLPDSAPGSHPATISTRRPTSVKAVEGDRYRRVDMEGMKEDPKKFVAAMKLMKNGLAYPQFRKGELNHKTPQQIERVAIDLAKSNLRFLYDHVPNELRAQGHLWYEGAHNFADRYAKEYNIPIASAAGVIAALSPQNLWDRNVRQAEVLLDVYHHQQDTPWSSEMDATSAKIWVKPDQVTLLRRVQGKKLSELQLPAEKAMWIRTYDESHGMDENGNRNFQRLSPDGRQLGPYLNLSGKPAQNSWQNLSAMSNAITALESGGNREILSISMGNLHKVRSFYNNILDPDSKNDDVTMDTHAVGAALLFPSSSLSTSVGQSLKTSPEKSKREPGFEAAEGSSITGVQGTYPLWADAYRELAHELKISPRELQSVTWEAKRRLFDGGMTDKTLKAVNNLWREYHEGKGTLEATRQAVWDQAGGVEGKRVDGVAAPPKAPKAKG